MRIRNSITQFIALSLVVLTTLSLSPVSFAEVVSPANIGSISPAGSVELRGVGIKGDGTLFSGDRVNVAPGAYANVVLGTGSKLELDSKSDVVVSKDGDTTNIDMKAGNIAFTAGQKPVRVRVGAYEVTANGQARASVAYVGSSAFGVRVLDGSVIVRDLSTKKSHMIQKGMEQLISLSDSTQTGSVRLASSGLPSSIPAVPAMPRQSSGGKKTALLIGTVLGSAAAIAVLMRKNDDNDRDAAARAAAAQQKQNGTQALVAASAALQTSTTVAASIESTTASVDTAIAAATNLSPAAKASLTDQSTALKSKIIASRNQIAALNIRIAALNAQLLTADPATTATIVSQINSLVADVNTTASQLNAQLNLLTTLVQSAQTNGVAVPNPPQIPQIPTVPPVASASTPDTTTPAFVTN